ncbi:MAG: hypothetical protein RIR11_5116, partial [Bacteroidota bacterium]
ILHITKQCPTKKLLKKLPQSNTSNIPLHCISTVIQDEHTACYSTAHIILVILAAFLILKKR